MDKKKIAFITCVNNEAEYAECRYYLKRLHIPEGYSADMICIKDALSMTAGYNAGMKDSDAKYKVYLHQDVFIKNVTFVADLLDIFACDEQIGLVGMVGNTEIGTTAKEVMNWNVGRVIYNRRIISQDFQKEGCFAEVAAADGLLLATQYDVPWREDIFDGWDFYDISQCMEFKRAGYKVVVPRQEEIWCYHDALGSKFTNYFDYYERFLREYEDMTGISAERRSEELVEWRQIEESAQKLWQLRGGGGGGAFRCRGKSRPERFFSESCFSGNGTFVGI